MREELRALVRMALAEDFRFGPDAATLATIDPTSRCHAVIRSREQGVVAALDAASLALEDMAHRTVEPNDPAGSSVTLLVQDGDTVEPGQELVRIEGLTASILGAERTMLNIISHASGIATATRHWVDAVAGTAARIRDTRKTLPGLRELQKYAVRCGGGVNHRMGLGDAAMIKDNHIAGVREALDSAGTLADSAGGHSASVAPTSVAPTSIAPTSIAPRRSGAVEAFERLKARFPDLPREIEVDTLDQLEELLPLAPELILLDNFTPEETRIAVELTRARCPGTQLESSGGLSLDVARDYADAGVDFLAVGALTHSVRALDIGLDFEQ